MRKFSATPWAMLSSLWAYRSLTYASAKREVLGRYKGSTLGLVWSFFNPLFMLAVYTIVFSEILKPRWNAGNDSKTEFALVLFAGLLMFNLFAECINRAPNLIVSNANYVKKVVFPLEILPVVNLISALFHAAISLLVWLLAYLVFFGMPHTTALYLPLVILPFAFFILGMSWALASLGVYLRDVSQVIGIITTVLMFMSPVFYPASSLPENYRGLLFMNPLTPVIEQSRDVLYWGIQPDFVLLAMYWFASVCIACLGFAWFQKTRLGFADVL